MPAVRDWKDIQDDLTFPYCAGVDPPARLAYLVGMDTQMLQAATTPYASQAVSFPSARKGATRWNWLQVFAPATWQIVGKLTKGHDGADGSDPVNCSTYLMSEPAAGPYEVSTPSWHDQGADKYPGANAPVNIQNVGVAATADYDVTPVGVIDRRYFFSTPTLNPRVEEFEGLYLHGFSCGTVLVSDLESY